jgi:hypothetical protein
MSLEYITGLLHQERESRLLAEVATGRLARHAGAHRRWFRRSRRVDTEVPSVAARPAAVPIDPAASATADDDAVTREHQPVG